MKKVVIVSIITSSVLFSTSVDNMVASSTNTNDGTTIEENSDVQQGTIDIQNSTVKNLNINSLNILRDVEVYGAEVEQATLKIEDSNASDSDANNVDIDTKNTISGGLIDVDSGAYQSTTEIVASSTVDGLNLKQKDKVDETTVEESELSQSWTMVKDSKLSNMTQSVKNSVLDTEMSALSLVEQSTTTIESSTVNNLTTTEDNEVDTATLEEAELTQGNIIIKG